MKITVHYETQLKRAIGKSTDEVEVNDQAGIDEVVKSVAHRHGEAATKMLLSDDRSVRSSVLVFVGDEQVSLDEGRRLNDGDNVTLMSPISGG